MFLKISVESDRLIDRLTNIATVRLMIQGGFDIFTPRLPWRGEFRPNIWRTRRVPPFHTIRKSNKYRFCFRIIGLCCDPG